MSRPFIINDRRGLSALPKWLNGQSFSVYSVSFGRKGTSISLGSGEGRAYRKKQAVIVNDSDLMEQAERIVRCHLGWQPR